MFCNFPYKDLSYLLLNLFLSIILSCPWFSCYHGSEHLSYHTFKLQWELKFCDCFNNLFPTSHYILMLNVCQWLDSLAVLKTLQMRSRQGINEWTQWYSSRSGNSCLFIKHIPFCQIQIRKVQLEGTEDWYFHL